MPTPLQGATFELRDSSGTVLLTGISDVAGIVDLGNVSPGTYTLTETSAPPGFIPGGPYTVYVFENGTVEINGIPLADFEAENFPFPNISFLKTDVGSDPLEGAVFELDDLSGTVIQSVSNIDGLVVFYTIPPGTYALKEISAPFGFIPDPTTYVVTVAPNGAITVNGSPIAGFNVINQDGPDLTFIKMDNTPQSPAPVIDPVREGLSSVTGGGISGSTVTVTWPDGSTSDALVGSGNTWTATPPVPLVIGEDVSAIQTVPGMLPSDPATETVQEASDQPTIDEVFEGDATVTGTGIDASIITVTWPNGATGTTPVQGDGTWSIVPPVTLNFGEEIFATQTTGTLLPSLPVDTTVQAVSPAPVINPVPANADMIGGTGIPGASISITWPGPVETNAVVGPFGTWISPVAVGIDVGDVISATQTVPGKLVSPATTTTVLAVSPPPDIDDILDGDTSIVGTGVADATINITWPDGSSGSATLDGTGDWTATAPTALLFNEIVTATQTVPGSAESSPVIATVMAISDPPVINPVQAGDITITGTGVAGSTINITWPNITTSTASVLGNGTWTAPTQGTLISGQFIDATQTSPGMLESPPTQRMVTGAA